MAKSETVVKPTAYPELAHGMAPLEKIVIAGNFRKNFNQDRLRELAANIKQVGVLEPVLCRPAETGADEDMILVAGGRRYAAAKLAGLTHIPFRLLELTAEQANEVQALENLHRENLGPIEEARAFKTLLEQGSYSVDDLAGRVNKHISYVYRAIKLLELPAGGVEAIEQGTITPAHGHQILSIPERDRAEALEYALTMDNYRERLPTASELREHISDHYGCWLKQAVFPTDIEYAAVEACASCPHNTANQTMLFDATVEGKCVDKPCFENKTKAFDEALAEQARTTCAGMTYLGIKDWSWGPYHDGESLKQFSKNGIILNDKIKKLPAVKTALKKTPEKFGYGVLKNEHTLAIVLTDKALYTELFPKNERQQEVSETPEQKEARLKKEFIDEAVAEALLTAAVLDKKPLTMAMICDMVYSIDGEYDHEQIYQQALNMKEISAKSLAKLTMQQVLKIGWLRSTLDYNYQERIAKGALKPLGLKTAEITARARKEALPAWEAHKKEQAELKAKEAAAKASKKSVKPEPEEDDDNDDQGDGE